MAELPDAMRRSGAHEVVRPMLRKTLEQMFSKAMLEHSIVRCPVNMSPSSPQIKPEILPSGVWIVYGRFEDSAFRKLEKIGISLDVSL